MKYSVTAAMMLAVVLVQGCASNDEDYNYTYVAPAYDSDYEKHKLEKQMERKINKQLSPQDIEALNKLEKK